MSTIGNQAASPKVTAMWLFGAVALVSVPKIITSIQYAKIQQMMAEAQAQGMRVNFQGNMHGFGPPPEHTINEDAEDGIDPNPVVTPKDELRAMFMMQDAGI